MKFVVALDSFKDCLSSLDAGNAVKSGILEAFPKAEVLVLPVADGGEGTTYSLTHGLGGEIISCKAQDPLGNEVSAEYGILSDGTAVLEMAAASGLELIPLNKRDPLLTSTYGTGQMILNALDRGVRSFIMGIGGSATNDAGMGMLRALGVVFKDNKDIPLEGKGQDLQSIACIDVSSMDKRLSSCKFLVACDVNNPLYGPNGAAFIYGPQKGADKEKVHFLDKGLENFAKRTFEALSKDPSNVPGAGAAGGLGAALYTYLNADLQPGISIILDYLKIDDALKSTDFVFAGEGRIDEQTAMGKAPAGVASRAALLNIPVIALGGTLRGDLNALHNIGICACFSIVPGPISLQEALNKDNAVSFLQRQARELCLLIKKVREIH
ncbi:MAG: glycerate kinase family protein [Brevinema sp.]